MTDRYYALTVILDKDMRDDDAECVINAIKMIKHVLDVKGNVSNPDTWMAEERSRRELCEKIWRILYPKG